MPRTKKITLDEIAEALKDEAVRKNVEILKEVWREAKKAGLDKMTMEEIDEEIRAAREEARKEKEAEAKKVKV